MKQLQYTTRYGSIDVVSKLLDAKLDVAVTDEVSGGAVAGRGWGGVHEKHAPRRDIFVCILARISSHLIAYFTLPSASVLKPFLFFLFFGVSIGVLCVS